MRQIIHTIILLFSSVVRTCNISKDVSASQKCSWCCLPQWSPTGWYHVMYTVVIVCRVCWWIMVKLWWIMVRLCFWCCISQAFGRGSKWSPYTMVITCFGKMAARLKGLFPNFSRLLQISSVVQLFPRLLSCQSKVGQLAPHWFVLL